MRGVRFRSSIRVLGSTTITGVSAWFRLYIAFLLLGKVPDKLLCFAFSFIAYSVYTLDRALKSKEDEVNRPEEANASATAVLFVAFIFFFTAILILIMKSISPWVALFPLIVGFLYTRGLKISNVSIKFKQSLGIKNFIVAFTWAFTLTLFIYNFSENYLQRFLIFIFFFFKSFVYTLICDCRDVKGDSIAGLITLPVYFGEAKIRIILQILHSSFHLSLMGFIFLGLVEFESTILLYSWAIGMIYISLYANTKKTIFRGPVVHGEWVHMLAFRNLAIQLSQSVSHSI